MSAETRLYPGDREPRAIKLRKPRHTVRKIIIIAVAAVIIIGAGGAFAWMYFRPEKAPSDGSLPPALSSESSSSEISEISDESSSEPEPSEPEVQSEPEPIAEEDTIPRNEWYMILVNRENPLPDDYSFDAEVIDSFGHSVDSRIVPGLEAMFAAGNEEGLSFSVYTAYRTVEKQREIFDAKVDSLMAKGLDRAAAEKAAEEFAAAPGTSEHNTGLALDIVSSYASADENSAEAKWLFEHAWEYGFILRYPKDKEEITGFDYEPWHYRYVGREQAKLIYESGLCLEEYLAQ